MMAEYEVRDVVCDYGVYEDGKLKLILNSRRIALQIVELLKEDERIHRGLNPIKDYPPYLDRPKHTRTPTADVEEVRHGYWKPSPDGINPIRCSECNMPALMISGENEFGDFVIERYPSNYCHSCGAKMDGRREENGQKT